MGSEQNIKPGRVNSTTSTEPQGGGWHKISDSVVDELLLKGKLSPGGLQLALLLIIQRNTWGAKPPREGSQRPAWAKLSITALAKMCNSGRGLEAGYTPRAVATALNDMLQRGIIAGRNAKGQPLRGALSAEDREKAAKSTAAAMYQSTPDRWKAAKPYVAPEVEEIRPLEAVEDDADELIEQVAAGDPVILMPGAKSKPMPMRIALKGREPIDVRWRAVNSGTSALSCHVQPDAAGLLTVTVSEKGESKANDYLTRLHKFAATAGIENPGNGTPSREAAYRKYMQELMLRVWSKPADATILLKVVDATKGAPVETFAQLVDQRIGRDNPKKLKSGILIELAKDAGRAFQSLGVMQQREEAEAADRREAELIAAERDRKYWTEPEGSPWLLVKKAVRQQISDECFSNWFTRSRFAGMDGAAMIVEVPDPGSAEYMADEYSQLATTMARGIQRGIQSVRFVSREASRTAAA